MTMTPIMTDRDREPAPETPLTRDPALFVPSGWFRRPGERYAGEAPACGTCGQRMTWGAGVWACGH